MPDSTDDEIVPYYTAKVKQGEKVVSSDSAPPTPPLPCTFESIAPSLLTGILGYIYGFGSKSISVLFNKKAPRGIRVVHMDGVSRARAEPGISCKLAIDLSPHAGMNHSAAGALSGLVIAWGNSPVNMLGSAVLLAAVSGYLARADPSVAQAHLLQPSTPGQKPSSRSSTHSSHTRSTQGQCASITGATMCQYSLGLLEQTAQYINCSATNPILQPNVTLVAATVWEAVKPGCRSCCAPLGDSHTDFL